MNDSIFIISDKNKKFKLKIKNKNILYIFKNIQYNYSYLSRQKVIKNHLPHIKDYITNFELDSNKELVDCILELTKKIKPINKDNVTEYYKIPVYVYHYNNTKKQNIMKLNGYYYMCILNKKQIKFLLYKEFRHIFSK